MSEPMTVLEFAVQHVEQTGCLDSVDQHVDMMIRCAVAEDRSLWSVIRDGEGRASLVWASHDVEVWESLLNSAIKLALIEQNIKRLFGFGGRL